MKHIKSEMIHVGLIHCFVGQNVSRQGKLFKDETDQNGLIALLFPGWKHEHSVGVWELTPGEQEQAVIERKQFREELERSAGAIENVQLFIDNEPQKVSIVKTEQLAAFDALYKSRKPKYGIVFGNRRMAAWYLVQAFRMHLNLPIFEHVQASIDEYENAVERARRNIEENELKHLGALEPNWLQKILAAKVLYEAGDNQSVLRRTFKAGNGQKLWWLLEANRQFKELDIIGRIQKGEILAQQLRWDAMKPICEANDSEAAAKYFAKPKEEGNRPKVADRSKWEGLKERNPVDFIRALADGHLNDNVQDAVKPFNEVADALNVAVATILGLPGDKKALLLERKDQLPAAILGIVEK